ncbi:MAG: glycoside hydrolase family 27 protein [Ginsengibacter sp.]
MLFMHTCCAGQHAGAIPLPAARFMTGDNSSWSSPSICDTAWNSIKTGEVWQNQGYPNYHGFAWYRIHIFIPSSLKQNAFWKDSLRLFLAHVNDVDATFLNGKLIGKTGSFPTDAGGYISKWPAIRNYYVAANDEAIKWDADNTIAIRVYDAGGTGGIFMGNPFIDMLEKTDGLSIEVNTDSIRYTENYLIVPVYIINHFQTVTQGKFSITILDAIHHNKILEKSIAVSLQPDQKNHYSLRMPNQPGIEFSYFFSEKNTSLSLQQTQTLPYTLTPKASPQPHIHSPSVYGVHPGSPFIFRIAVSGQKPIQYISTGLPKGVVCSADGIISGAIADTGNYTINITAGNNAGKAHQKLTLKAGSQLALTPPMGWNSWNCWGINVSEDKVKNSAQALINKGLADYGWNYINIDDGWQEPKRSDDSSIIPNNKFGKMKQLGDWLHSKGLHFGIYSSPGPLTCGGFLGSYKNELKDAATYANWGIDYLKYDWCSYDRIAGRDTSFEAYIRPYALMDSALQLQHRNIFYSLCQYGMKDVWKWGAQVSAQSWRTTEDIEDTWQSLSSIGFEQYALYPYAGPGHWNDPDMMIVGDVGWGESLHPSRLTPDEQYTHVSLWCLLSAPLLIGCDLSKLNAFTINLLTNSEVLAIDQDIAGKQAQRIIKKNNIQVWIKDMHDGSKAMGIFNMEKSYRTIRISSKDLGLNKKMSVRDVWREKDLGTLGETFTTFVAPHGVTLIRVENR